MDPYPFDEYREYITFTHIMSQGLPCGIRRLKALFAVC
jgi:hypothetical protein